MGKKYHSTAFEIFNHMLDELVEERLQTERSELNFWQKFYVELAQIDFVSER